MSPLFVSRTIDRGPSPYTHVFYWARTKWRAWKNSDGVTGNIRRHLRKDHGDSYWVTVRREKLKGWNTPPDISPLQDEAREPFNIIEFRNKLVRFVVINDQVCFTLSWPGMRCAHIKNYSQSTSSSALNSGTSSSMQAII